MPFLLYRNRSSGKNHQVMVVSSSNEVMNSLAADLANVTSQFVTVREVIVVRCHAIETGNPMAWLPAREAALILRTLVRRFQRLSKMLS